MDKSPAKSMVREGLRARDNALFKDFYDKLISHFEPILLVSRIDGVSFSHFYTFDSRIIILFSDIMKGGAQSEKRWKEKRCFESAHANTAKYAEAKMHDKIFYST